MRSALRPFLLLLASSPCLIACATGKGTSGVAPSPGVEAVTRRIQELNEKASVATTCQSTKETSGQGGIFEVTASSDGKLVARAISWSGGPEVSACIVAAAQTATVSPMAGPPVSTVWQFRPRGSGAPPAPPEAGALQQPLGDLHQRMAAEVEGCAQRHLPPEFPADIEVEFVVYPGGRIGASNVLHSTSDDGNFDVCVQEVFGRQSLPSPRSEGIIPLKLQFHVGSLDKL